MAKIDDVRKEMAAALKAGDKPRKDALSLLLSALKSKQIDKREPLSEEEENAVVYREIKEARETLETTPPTRTQIIDECKLRIEVYSAFAPQRMGEEEIRQALKAVLEELNLPQHTPKDKGRIMKALMPRLQGRADGATVNKLVTAAMQAQ